MLEIRIESLWIYPIKSCGALAQEQIFVDQDGPLWDRKWMIVDENGQFLTQRTHPQMALIQPSLEKGKLFVEINGEQFSASSNNSQLKTVQVWKSSLQADLIENAALTEALSNWLGKKVFLVEYGKSSQRKVSLKGETLKNSVRFADGFPWLLGNVESLSELNRGLVQGGTPAVPMNRFRPNIVVSGLAAYQEDHLQSFSLRGLRFQNLKACSRCPITTIDQVNGIKTGHEPLVYLAAHRKFNGQVYFGSNLVSEGEGFIKVGDVLDQPTLIETPII